ncbi:hypothetical protein [uncultured Gimesia sp.]|uniref:hypothetical protein n=1 Tax=uncultured Gimesia sp. TaxID=1678688 RepID=UPI00262518B8|nr:hypothetical protein [uncultured Gimesia sp.]
MAWPEITIEDLPPKRDDEPVSLREDILDELTDHFVCALNRELLKNPDEQTAKQRVLNQFGDPVKIARQLWLEAMKERIMSQRIMTGISAVMAVCSIAVVGIAWMLMRDSQGVNQKMLAQLAVIADRPQADSTVVKSLQRTNEAIVRELKILAESQRPSQQSGGMGSGFGSMMGQSKEPSGSKGSRTDRLGMGGFGMAKPDEPSNINQQILKQLEQLNKKSNLQDGSTSEVMNQISFQLVQKKEDGKPAIGFIGSLTKIGTDAFSLSATSDEKGTLDFGKLPWGKYDLSLKSPWNEKCQLSRLTMIPGRSYSQTIVCPVAPPEEVPVEFQVNMKKNSGEEWQYLLCDFRNHDYGADPISFRLQSSRKIQNDYWSFSHDLQKQPERGVYLIDIKNNQVIPCPMTVKGKYKNLDLQDIVWQKSAIVLQGQYIKPVVYLIRKRELSKLSEINSLKNIGTITSSSLESEIEPEFQIYTKVVSGLFLDPFEKLKIAPQLQKKLEQMGGAGVMNVLHGYHYKFSRAYGYYLATKAGPNVWEINVPKMRFISGESGSLK